MCDFIIFFFIIKIAHGFDTVKVRAQTSKNFNGVFNLAKEMAQKEGLSSFYRGFP